MTNTIMKNNKGFTLIELLVVISIVGLMSSVVLASLSTARSRGRDAKRLADVTAIRSALQLYWLENNGTYPATSGGGGWYSYGACGNTPNQGLTGAGGYIPGLAPTYIPVLPTDPISGNCYLYTTFGSASDYMFMVYGGVEGTVPNSLKRSSQPGEKDYAIYTPGASNW